MFKSSVTPVEDAGYLGCSSKSITVDNVDRLKELILENIRGTTSEVADMLGVLFSSVQSLRSSFFWDGIHCRFVISCQHFGTA
jgi:hypothetical protein